jgi:hypothetical protein
MDTLFEQIAIQQIAEKRAAPLLPQTQRAPPPGRAPVGPPPVGPPPPGWRPSSSGGGEGGAGGGVFASDRDDGAAGDVALPPDSGADDEPDGFVTFTSRLVRARAAPRGVVRSRQRSAHDATPQTTR